ncbi:RNA polymerase factor sigma-54 [Sediminitomix flava]|uniref:RNA polymerase RpoN-/SigL-like sigma 54 subunit n=1 Tax=Sediminitomix flava TaxID=379075 RepID=A0A315ZH21_SEDFL|nr:RNA polymerase factor sigma-54 [Sediminitomix flava]PWJ44148.1 RNA polymerase RpoN-/SigL-like sigma 54 subunit [Sediminitomix flava]
MQKLNLTQSLRQNLSPQQIQFIKLLQIPTAELQTRIEEELEINPALEEGKEDETYSEEETSEYEETVDSADDENFDEVEDISLEEYANYDDAGGYKMQGDGPSGDEEDRDMPIAMSESLMDNLMDQLGFLKLDERQLVIGKQLVGSIDNDGYIRRELEAIVNDLAFLQNIDTNLDEVEDILKKIQTFEPAGIAARDLQECLDLQLQRRPQNDKITKIARKVILLTFEEFKKKHFTKIQKKLGVTDEELKEAFDVILKLTPKPGGFTSSYAKTQYITPDFIVKEINGKLEVSLNSRNAPELKISRSYAEMIDSYEKSEKKDRKMKQTVTFVKQKLDAAKWFIDAIRQRQETLLKTMNAIVDYQKPFFLSGDEGRLKPMILKDIAEIINMDISTVSRVANSKAVQTDLGIYQLKYFFSESISTDTGEEVSSKEVKHVIKNIIDDEDKRKPLSDEKIEKLLKIRGYNIARRTVAKYREQMGMPVARLRKKL